MPETLPTAPDDDARLRLWMDDYDRILAELARDPDGFSARFHDDVLQREFTPSAIVDRVAMAIAVLDIVDQRTLFETDGMGESLRQAIDWDMAEQVARSGKSRMHATGADSGPAVVAYVSPADAADWDLPDMPGGVLDRASRAQVIFIAQSDAGTNAIIWACQAFAMTPLETRAVVAALVAPTMKLAAEQAGISHDMMRQAISAATAKTGARNFPGLVQTISLLSMGIDPASHDREEVLMDLWGLTPRQAAVAALLAQGLSRRTAAHALNVSEATIKKETEIVFANTAATSAADLSRRISAAYGMHVMAGASGGRVSWADRTIDPLRFVLRRDGSRIAISDYGPRDGKPALIVHSSMTSRHPPRELVAELVRQGYRPITIDRPGYGLTDLEAVADIAATHDPFVPAARDIATVMDALKLDKIDVIARGGAQVVLAFATLSPERLGAVLLVNPDPPTKSEKRRIGPIGAFKEFYLTSPWLIAVAGHFLARQLNRKTAQTMLRRSMQYSAPDRELLEDPAVIDDYYRALRGFAAGKLQGYIREQTYFATRTVDPYRPDSTGWKVLIAGNDTFGEPADMLAYWRNLLPDATVELVPEAGRLLAYADPKRIVDELAGLDYTGRDCGGCVRN